MYRRIWASAVHTVEFQTLAVDAGPAREGERVRATFRFRNDGRRTAQILDVVPTCGLEADLIRGSMLAPGQDGEIEVRINTVGNQGSVSGEVMVTLKDPVERTVVLSLKANVEREFVRESSLIDLGDIAPGMAARRNLAIRLNTPSTP